MHRDSHAPLKPIFGNHFLALACHEMSIEDLEVCKLGGGFPHRSLTSFSGPSAIYFYISRITFACQLPKYSLTSCLSRFLRYDMRWNLSMSGKLCSAKRGSSSSLLRAVRTIPLDITRLSRLDLVGPSMLRFPVSLLTATVLIEAIKRVIRRRLSRTKLNAPAESLKSTSDCPMKHSAPGMPPRGGILERKSSDIELGVLRATSAVSEDIRKVLGLSTVTMSYLLVVFQILMHLRRRLMSVRNGSNRCDRLLKSQFARSTS
jgi:hypothetical protein